MSEFNYEALFFNAFLEDVRRYGMGLNHGMYVTSPSDQAAAQLLMDNGWAEKPITFRKYQFLIDIVPTERFYIYLKAGKIV